MLFYILPPVIKTGSDYSACSIPGEKAGSRTPLIQVSGSFTLNVRVVYLTPLTLFSDDPNGPPVSETTYIESFHFVFYTRSDFETRLSNLDSCRSKPTYLKNKKFFIVQHDALAILFTLFGCELRSQLGNFNFNESSLQLGQYIKETGCFTYL